MFCALRFEYPSVSIPRLSSVRPHRPPHSLFSSIPVSGDSLTHSQITASAADTRHHHSGTRYRYPRDGSPESDEIISFEHAVSLFNSGDYYRCHDFLEEIWYDAEEPTRTIIHGILQCAVGFHHLFNQNHRGAMMELGEGLCKLRKMGFESGPFLRFEQEVSEALEFVYQTQKELAACADDLCITMDGSEISYRLLGSFAAGQDLYRINHTPEGSSVIVFTSNNSSSMIKVPTLDADDTHLEAFQYRDR